MDTTEIVITVIGGIFDIIICILVPWLLWFLHKKNEDTEDEQEKEYIDQLIDAAGNLIIDVVESLDPTKDKESDVATATSLVNTLLDADTKNAIAKRTNNRYDKYIDVKVKSAYYRKKHQITKNED